MCSGLSFSVKPAALAAETMPFRVLTNSVIVVNIAKELT